MNDTQAKWLFRGTAAAVILLLVALNHQLYPMADRGVMHPDDRNALLYGRQVMKSGWPAIPYRDLDPDNVSTYPVLAPIGSRLNDRGEAVTTGAPGLFFLLAPFTGTLGRALAWMEALSALSAFVVYLYLESRFTRPAALAGLVAFAGSASVLFWSTFMMANVPAIGFLLGGLLLFGKPNPWARAGGALLVGASPLFRFEYLILVLALGIGWLILEFPKALRTSRLAAWLPPAGAAAGFGLLLLASLALFGTVNFVSVSRATGTSLDATLAGTAANTGSSVFQSSVETFVPLVALHVAALLALAFDRSRRWPHWPLVVGVAVMSLYLLITGFKEQLFLMSNSYTRYLIPLVATGAIGVAFLFERLTWAGRGALAVALALMVVASGLTLAGEDGYDGARGTLALLEQQRAPARNLTADSVFIGDYAYADNVRVLTTRPIPEAARAKEVPAIVAKLLDLDKPVFVSKRFTGGQTRAYLLQDGRFTVTDAPGGLWRVALKPR